jgi:uncharacterized protein (DUF1501 family)
MTISRRTFLSLGGAAVAVGAAGAIVGTEAWRDLVEHHANEARSAPTTSHSAHPNRVLVVIDLGGGNDGLNTLVPADGRYRDARPTLAVPENRLIALSGTTAYALNPALAPLKRWWDSKQLAAVDGLAIPDQTRSHFVASDVWWSGESEGTHSTGWLGRWLDAQPDPTNPLRAISLGLDTQAFLARQAMATVVSDPSDFELTLKGADPQTLVSDIRQMAQPLSNDDVMAASQRAIPDTLKAIDTLSAVFDGPKAVTFPVSDSANSAPTGSAAAGAVLGGRITGTGQAVTATSLLEAAAGIINLAIGTQVIMVSVTGFDTHSDQLDRHPLLLSDFAQGLDGFLRAMQQQGRSNDVLVVTTSEFGRRVAENGSGTDHGNASVHFLAGAGVRGGQVVGRANLAQLDEGDVPLEIDSRSIYAAALDWLGGPTDEILGRRYDRYDLVA